MSSVKLGKIFGIKVNLHYTWFFIFFLLAWSLAIDYFPAEYKGFTNTSYWVFGVIATLLLFLSVLMHEFSHSLVAKKEGMHVEGITLFFFGGVASASEENLTPEKEFKIAIAGPIFSILLGGFFFLLTLLPLANYVLPVIDYLFKLNIILAVFNMIPGFPLDGGRVFRSIVWKITGDLKKATKIASTGGRSFGLLMILYGFFNLFTNGFGLWYILLGSFLYVLAKASLSQTIIKAGLSEIKINKITDKKFTKIKSDENVESFVDNFVMKGKDKFVVEQKNNYFLLNFDLIKRLPRHEWPILLIKDIMVKINPVNDKDTAYKALLKMEEQNTNMLPVIKNKKIIGVITLDSLLRIVRN